MKTAKIQLETKEPDRWWDLLDELNVPLELSEQLIEFGECATVELELDEKLQVVGGRLVPLR